MIKLLGNFLFLALLYFAMFFESDAAREWENHRVLAQRVGQAGILSLGAGILIITGGIDLSMGSVVALASTVLGLLMTQYGVSPWLAVPLVLLLGAVIGLGHGLLVTYVRLQAFIVTLCGLFIYRGIARWLAGDKTVGLGTGFAGLKDFFNGELFELPVHFLILLVLLAVLGLLLHFTVYGRYAFALGSNEHAARYCGVRTDVYQVLAYVVCSTLTAGYGVLLLFKSNSVQPNTTGNFLELYAIAAAVIGGCSLRGGEGNVLGIFMGTCVITLLPTYVLFNGISPSLEYAIIGGALLLGALIDETVRRYYAARKV